MPKIKRESDENKMSRSHEQPEEGDEIDERFELDFVEESAGDELIEEGERPFTPRSLSAPRSPDMDAVGEETVVLHAGEYEDEELLEKKIKRELGPKTPPEGGGTQEESVRGRTEKVESRGVKRRRSTSSRSVSKDSNSKYSRNIHNGRDSPPLSYKDRDALGGKEDDLSVEDRIRQNKQARLVRLREARSRQIGYEYVPKSKAFPPQPYFKNPSYYPDEQRGDKAKPPPPPPAQRIQPLPGGRLPLVQRRSSPAPFERRRSPPPQRFRRSRGGLIVEESFRVTARRSPPSRRSRSPPSYRSGSSHRSSKELGSQTLYPSRRNPYPPPRSGGAGNWSGRDYGGSSSRSSTSYNRSYSNNGGSGGGSSYIYTGDKYVPRPFIPPPPPGKKWNCPRREEPYVPPSTKKWRCPQRESTTPPGRY